MDQVACSVGGAVTIDFADPKAPIVEKLDTDVFDGYTLCIVNTGGSHADLTDDYAAVPREMKSVAAHFGKKVLREVTRDEVVGAIPALRGEVGDRAIIRAMHFFDENERVAAQVEAIKNKDVDAFFGGVLSSGRSSFCYLQNVFTPKNPSEQGVSLALCVAESYLKNKKAAWRVHGGGFAGTIQAFVPTAYADSFAATMDAVLGAGACHKLRIRKAGAERVL
jgi:galactokinase